MLPCGVFRLKQCEVRLEDDRFRSLKYLRENGKRIALFERWSIISAGNLDEERFVDSFRLKVFRETFAEQRSMNAHDVVGGGVVMLGPSEDFISKLKFMDIVHGFVQHSVTEVEE